MNDSIQLAIDWFDELAPDLQTKGRLHWQTLKSVVLAQQTTNKQIMPCEFVRLKCAWLTDSNCCSSPVHYPKCTA